MRVMRVPWRIAGQGGVAGAALVATLLLHARPACSDDLSVLRKRGTLRVLAVDGSPQFFALREEKGLDREILSGFARVAKLKLDVVPVASWDALIPALTEGRGDLAAGGVTATEARLKVVAFTSEVFPSRYVVVTRRPGKAVRSLDDLGATKVGTVKGTSLQDVIREAHVPAANVDDAIASGKLPEALKSGRVAAIVMGVEDAIAAQQNDPAVELGLFVGPRQSRAFAVRKEAPDRLFALNDYLGNLRKTPTWNRLVVKYFGDRALEILQKAQAP